MRHLFSEFRLPKCTKFGGVNHPLSQPRRIDFRYSVLFQNEGDANANYVKKLKPPHVKIKEKDGLGI